MVAWNGTKPVEYQIVSFPGDECPACGTELECLFDLNDQDAPAHAERCPECGYIDNVFVDGAEWPEEE